MGANSIYANLTAENTAAEISMLLSADYNRKRTVIMLEGEDDVKVFRFLVSRDVTLIKAYGASTTIDKFLPKTYPDEPRVIGIRDRDYKEEKRGGKIFYCDHCNCEMMLISDDETFEKVAVNFYKGKLNPLTLRAEILSKLYFLSLIRMCSEKHRWGLRISDTDLGKVFNPRNNPTRNEIKIFVNSYNKKNRIDGRREKILRGYGNAKTEEQCFDITNGHDFVDVFWVYCTESASNTKRRSMTPKSLAAALRCSYSNAAFTRTDLYAALSEYGKAHNLQIVKP